MLAAALTATRADAVLHDHLKCYKLKDGASFAAKVDLRPLDDSDFVLDVGCTVKVRSRQLCVPVQKADVTSDAPRFDISDQATLHLDDTTPLDIGTPGSPAVVAAPVKSMFQTNSIALRLLLDVNWTIRRTGTIAWVASVTW
jgi:hypothetical protein